MRVTCFVVRGKAYAEIVDRPFQTSGLLQEKDTKCKNEWRGES